MPVDDDTRPSGSGVSVVETHTAHLVFAGNRVYKIKKPVRLPFVDFTDRDSREAACRHEIGLNRRLSPDVYLGLGSIHVPDRADPEPMVVMRRLPETARLSTLVRSGADVTEALRATARAVADFHSGAARGPAISECAGPEGLLRRWTANLDETQEATGTLLDAEVHDAIRHLAVHYVEGRRTLLLERAAAGYAVDGHGDLLADDVYWTPDGPRILDCLDFDDRLRYVDVLDDIAFLAVDLELLGRPDLAQVLLDAYDEYSGLPAPNSLRHHYLAYRAFVRAKIACVRSGQGLPADRAQAEQAAALALEHLRAGDVQFVLVGGAPGSGKTTVAGALADARGWVVLSSDRIRQELGVDPGQRYVPAAKDEVYRVLVERAALALRRGESVVADATWPDAAWRRVAADVATDTCSRLTMIECVVPPAVAAERAEARLRAGGSASEAGADVALLLARHRDPWVGASPVDTTGDVPTAVAAAVAAIGYP